METINESINQDAKHGTLNYFEFTGTGKEYFRIWIQNIVLSVLTLGIYSAWAKVRKQKYFHRHTRFANASFDYHAKPLNILIGRLILLLPIGITAILAHFHPLISVLGFVAFYALLPWFIVRSQKFRMANTSYRGVRFSFKGKTSALYGLAVQYFFWTLITFGLGAYWAMAAFKTYIRSNVHFGDKPFTSQKLSGRVFLNAIAGSTFLAYILLGLLTLVLGFLIGGAAPFIMAPLYIILFPAFTRAYSDSKIFKECWSKTRLAGRPFTTDIEFGTAFRLQLKNWALILATLGFYWPYAVINIMKYKANSLALPVEAADIVAINQMATTKTGIADEALDLNDFDIGL